jgi:hypothetical protein
MSGDREGGGGRGPRPCLASSREMASALVAASTQRRLDVALALALVSAPRTAAAHIDPDLGVAPTRGKKGGGCSLPAQPAGHENPSVAPGLPQRGLRPVWSSSWTGYYAILSKPCAARIALEYPNSDRNHSRQSCRIQRARLDSRVQNAGFGRLEWGYVVLDLRTRARPVPGELTEDFSPLLQQLSFERWKPKAGTRRTKKRERRYGDLQLRAATSPTVTSSRCNCSTPRSDPSSSAVDSPP